MKHGPAITLLEVQAADIDLIRARKRLEELPEKKAILEVRAKMKQIAALGAKASMLLKKLEAELKARQDEIAMLASKIEVEQAKIMETADHRQITSLTREMDALKRRMDKLEMESLQYMERIEKATEQLATIEGHSDKLKEQDSVLVAQYREAGALVQSEISTLETTLKKLSKSLPKNVLDRYESIREAKGGVAVGKLENGTCTACRMALPAQQVRRLLDSGDDIGLCPECRRLIVVRVEDDE